MPFRRGKRLDPTQVEDLRGRRAGRMPGGIALGGGGGIIGVIVVILFLVLSCVSRRRAKRTTN